MMEDIVMREGCELARANKEQVEIPDGAARGGEPNDRGNQETKDLQCAELICVELWHSSGLRTGGDPLVTPRAFDGMQGRSRRPFFAKFVRIQWLTIQRQYSIICLMRIASYQSRIALATAHNGTLPPGSRIVAVRRRLAGASPPHPTRHTVSKVTQLKNKTAPDLDTPTDLKGVADISNALNTVLADSFALYLKTKNFHWHVSGPHFRDYHLMFDEQGAEIFATTDEIAERIRKIGGTTLRSIGHIGKLQTLADNDEEFVSAGDMVRELMNDNKAVIAGMRKAHKVADEHEDVATASILENFIDAAEKRTWFLFEAARHADKTGH
jgi:starvation-inducible DNA-binding protein